ncbi:hypothetical protein ES702_05038 [subsurface metagenome]
MFYAFSYTPTVNDVAETPKNLELRLAAGVIHQVDVLFQNGCAHEEFVQIFDDIHQLWPSNRGEKLRGNATVISFREFYELTPGNSTLTAKIWSTLSTPWYEIIIQIGLLPKRIIQPMSFDELLSAAKGY